MNIFARPARKRFDRSLGRKVHGHIIGACPGAGFTHVIYVLSLAGVACGIVILSIIRRCRDQYAVAVHVDIGRGRAAPSETH